MTHSSATTPLVGIGLALCLLVVVHDPAAAQVGLGVGLASPGKPASNYRVSGPKLSLSMESRLSDRFRIRGSLGAAFFPGRPTLRNPTDLVIVGADAAVVLRASGGLAPYALAGVGYYWMRLDSDDPRIGSQGTPAFQVGFGLEHWYGSFGVFAEIQWKLLLTDYASDDFAPFHARGLTAGVRLPLP